MHRTIEVITVGITIFLILIFLGAIIVSSYSNTSQIESSPSSTTEPSSTPAQKSTIVDAATLYNLINGLRNESNMPELNRNTLLEKSAQLKLQDMISNEYWRHQDTENVESWYLFTQAGYSYTRAGENLAFGLNTSWDIFDGWLTSPRHKQELLTKEYEDMGLAIDCQTYKQAGKPSCIVVLHLGAD